MNRRAVILAALAALPAAASLVPGHAKSRPAARRKRGGLAAPAARFRIVTRTFTSTGPITTPSVGPAAPYPSLIRVTGLTQGRILKVRLILVGLSHAAPEELDVMLAGPSGRAAVVMSDVGGDDDVAGITLIFDQDAPNRLPDPLASGSFQPLNDLPNPDPFPPPAPGVTGHSLTVFNNTNPNGWWKLFVVDGDGFDQGSIAGWALMIRARVRVPHRHRRNNTRRAKRQ